MLCASVPLVLREEIYATAAVVGAALYLLVAHNGGDRQAALLACGGAALLLRLVSIRFRVRLPKLRR